MQDNTYNGWTNYETWKTHLEILDGYEWADAETLRDLAEDVLMYGVEHPTAEAIIDAFLSQVNFEEISEALKEQVA